MKTFKTRIFQFLIILSFCFFSNLNHCLSQICGDTQEHSKDATLSSFQSTTTNEAEAKKQYETFAGLNVGPCKKKENCSKGSECKLIVFEVEKLPNPRPNRHSKLWEFPAAQVKVHFECTCKSTVVIILDDVPFDPYIDFNEFLDEDTEGRKMEYTPDHNIKVYPNPTRSELQIDMNDFEEYGDYEIRIYNTVGTLMETQKINISEKSQNVYEVKTSDYTSGIYYLTVSNGTKVVSNTKFIVALE